jgi:hypothetical protein
LFIGSTGKLLRGKFAASIACDRGRLMTSLARQALLKDRMNFRWRTVLFLRAALLATIQHASADQFPINGPTVPGSMARLRFGTASAPETAPGPVKRAIWAANRLRGKPYRFGGGHQSFSDSGYDCSGTVSYALGAAGLINYPMSSSDLAHYGSRGRGKWITVYARNGHAFAVIAGLRLDTTAWNNRSDRSAPGWQIANRPPSGFEARHPAGF